MRGGVFRLVTVMLGANTPRVRSLKVSFALPLSQGPWYTAHGDPCLILTSDEVVGRHVKLNCLDALSMFNGFTDGYHLYEVEQR